MSGLNTRPRGVDYVKTVASKAYAPGDLLYDNGSGAVLPASQQTDQLSQALNQEMFAANFVGVSNGKKLSSNTGTNDLPVVRDDQIIKTACASTTWAVGDLVGAVEAASGTALENQVVAKVTDPALAIGVCAKAGSSVTTVEWVPIFRPRGGVVQCVRKRFTIAEVNAGATLLPIRYGYKYRMVGCLGIAIGGAVGATTTVDVLGTQSASGVKLVAYAQASMTQNTVLRDGASGATVLAAAASYAQNDVSTPITVGKTSSDITTATHIEFVLQFVAERA